MIWISLWRTIYSGEARRESNYGANAALSQGQSSHGTAPRGHHALESGLDLLLDVLQGVA